MNINNLSDFIDGSVNQGLSISQIERIRISCSLKLLQSQMKSESMYFLGKVLAVKSDYLLAFSTENNREIPSIFFCSQDAITWFSLTKIDESLIDEVLRLREPLTGVLTSETTLGSGKVITEEMRLAAIFSDIYENCLLVPRGFLLQTAMDYVLPNPLWDGIQLEACGRLSQFRHWRNPKRPQTLLEKSLSNPALDFLDPLAEPKVWRYSVTAHNDEVQLKSLRWPGFQFSLKEKRFGNWYFGNGVCEAQLLEEKKEAPAPEQATAAAPAAAAPAATPAPVAAAPEAAAPKTGQ